MLSIGLVVAPGLLAAQATPDPGLSPAQVVAAQLEALQSIDQPTPGGLVNNRGATIEDVVVEDDTAFVATKVIARSGEVLTYVFILGRGPHEGCEGCWMTDGVTERTSATGGELAT